MDKGSDPRWDRPRPADDIEAIYDAEAEAEAAGIKSPHERHLEARMADRGWAADYLAARDELVREERRRADRGERELYALRRAALRVVIAHRRTATEEAKARNPSWEALLRDNVEALARVLDNFGGAPEDVPDPAVPPTRAELGEDEAAAGAGSAPDGGDSSVGRQMLRIVADAERLLALAEEVTARERARRPARCSLRRPGAPRRLPREPRRGAGRQRRGTRRPALGRPRGARRRARRRCGRADGDRRRRGPEARDQVGSELLRPGEPGGRRDLGGGPQPSPRGPRRPARRGGGAVRHVQRGGRRVGPSPDRPRRPVARAAPGPVRPPGGRPGVARGRGLVGVRPVRAPVRA